MGLLDRILGTKPQNQEVDKDLFSFVSSSSAPDWKSDEYKKAYKGFVYGCVKAIADEVATIEIQLEKKTADGWEKVESHPILDLLNGVNPTMTSDDLWRSTQSWLELEGDSFWLLNSNVANTKPVEIWPLDPSAVTVVKDPKTFVGGYTYTRPDNKKIPFETKDIIHFKEFNPINPYRGMGAVQAAALSIDQDTFAAEWNRNFFYNSAQPSGALEFPGTVTTEQYSRIVNAWNAKFKGRANAHKIAVLEGGSTYKPIAMTQKDMDFLESRKFTMDEICAIFRVPKALLGMATDFNRANIEGIQYMFSYYVIKPKMDFIVTRLNEFLLPRFNINTNEMRLTYKNPVPQNADMELRSKQTSVGGVAWMTPNEIRAEEGKQPIPGGDALYTAGGLPITDSATPTPAKSKRKSKSYDKAMESLIDKRVNYIASQIKKNKEKFHKILTDEGDHIVEILKEKKGKSITKSESTELVRLIFADLKDWVGLLHNATKDSTTEVLGESGKRAIQQVGVDISFDLQNPRALEWLADHATETATSISSTTVDDVSLVIMEGVEQGSSIDEIADGIKQYFEDQSTMRALRIARTEVISAYAQGSLEGYRQTGVVKGKTWLTAGDDKVEEECLANADQGVVGLEDEFQSGDLVPPVHPNCRCAVQPEV